MAITATRCVILLFLLLAAVISYGAGFGAGIWLFVVMGAAFELSFWIKLIKLGNRDRRKVLKPKDEILTPTDFFCFNCKSTISKNDKKCPRCGWTWETQNKY